jgi:uncharacterized membrane protein
MTFLLQWKHGKENMSKNSPQNRKNQQEVTRREVSVSKTEYRHSGPIPDPLTLEHYEMILPGAAERIMKMAENQSEHRRYLERTVIDNDVKNSRLGVWFGFLVAIITLGVGTFIILNDHEVGGTIIGGSGLAGLVGVFIYGTNSSKKERNENK